MSKPLWMTEEQLKLLSDAHDGERCARLPYCSLCDLIARLQQAEARAKAAEKLVKVIEQIITMSPTLGMYLKLDDAMAEYYRSVNPDS